MEEIKDKKQFVEYLENLKMNNNIDKRDIQGWLLNYKKLDNLCIIYDFLYINYKNDVLAIIYNILYENYIFEQKIESKILDKIGFSINNDDTEYLLNMMNEGSNNIKMNTELMNMVLNYNKDSYYNINDFNTIKKNIFDYIRYEKLKDYKNICKYFINSLNGYEIMEYLIKKNKMCNPDKTCCIYFFIKNINIIMDNIIKNDDYFEFINNNMEKINIEELKYIIKKYSHKIKFIHNLNLDKMKCDLLKLC